MTQDGATVSKPIAILPIKSFDEAKQRLRDALGPSPRAAIVQAMFSDVLVALRRSTQVDRVLVVSSDHGAQRMAEGYGAVVVDDDERGHNQAATRGISHALELGAQRVLLVPGDCPLLDPRELDALIEEHAEAVVIVPDRHGTGTNALLLSPPNVLGPAFGPLSRTRHEQKARAAGLTMATVAVPSLALDLDTPEDMVAIEAALASGRGGAAHTRGMLSQLARIR
jgi:2-phospho-L-lactate guanylyltransferase